MPWIMKKHYAKRMPPMIHAFGLFKNKEIVGVCAYGPSPSDPLRKGICGIKYRDIVFEFNRLCLQNNKKNEGSFL